MKLMETHFDEYINSIDKNNLHPKLLDTFNNFPSNIAEVSNLIFYGPNGVGKYSQMLKLISRYSPSSLKYEKKICVIFQKNNYFVKISDIHYEIDMSLLGCNSKLLWNDIFSHIIDSISAKKERIGFIVCKFFNLIPSELLECFYSYMQNNYSLGIQLKFIILTSEISFIPENIINCCKIISVARPTITNYNKCLKKDRTCPIKNTNAKDITNMKGLVVKQNHNIMMPHKIICDKIINNITNYEDMCFYQLRDVLYDLFIYDINVSESIWYIINDLESKGLLDNQKMSKTIKKSYEFFKYYNNNYRPIYHLENYILNIIKIVYEL